MPARVVVVEYDQDWPILFEEERRRVLEAIGHKVSAVEHIGSTAVPGLGAKPIIDMMAGVPGEIEAGECIPLLRGIGYTSVTPHPEDPDMYYCLGKGPHSVGYHLHLVRFRSAAWDVHLLFRDYLRSHPDSVRRYYRLKRRLAAQYGSERGAYTESKTSFIKSIITKARKSSSLP